MSQTKAILVTAAVFLLVLARPAAAHRLDEYLQAATIDVGREQVNVELRLTPGVAVFPQVIAEIDTDRNGVISDAEQQAYARRVCADVSLLVGDVPVQLRAISSTFPTVPEMKDGLGDIVLQLHAPISNANGSRTLQFENRHQSAISAYLVTCLVPTDPGVQVLSQTRSLDQSIYKLEFTQSADAAAVGSSPQPSRMSLFEAYFSHGIRHILTGYDHLLFVGALVLAAASLWDLVKVVSAFTFAHTITLTLAALNVVHVSDRIVEPLISASIVVVAAQNIFWPDRSRGWSRLAAAFFFGLFHGLGFAGGLLDAMRELPGTSMLVAILAFSLGVEVGHQLIVLPLFSLLKMTRPARPLEAPSDFALRLQRIGSLGISIAGAYYLCIALFPRS